MSRVVSLLTILFIILLSYPFYSILHILLRDLMGLENIFNKLQSFRSQRVTIFSEYLLCKESYND